MPIPTLTRDDLKTLLTTDDPETIALMVPDEMDEREEGYVAPEELGLTLIDEGACAAIIAHPTDPDKVIRVCEETDGWIIYACGRGQDSPHRPRVFGAAWTGVCWVAVVERLRPAPLAEARTFIDCVNAAVVPGARPVPSAQAARAAQDALNRNLAFDDLEPRNVMMRATGEIVLNDPLSFMTFRQLREMQTEYAIPDADTPSPWG